MKFQIEKVLSTFVLVPAMFLSTLDVKAQSASRFAIGLLGGVSVQNPSFSEGTNDRAIDGSFGFGGGISAEMTLSQGLGLEANLLYLNHKFTRDTDSIFGTSVSSTFHSGYIHVPLMLRFHALSFLNLGIGGYYGRTITSWEVSAAGFDQQLIDYHKDYYGYIGAVGVSLPLAIPYEVSADLRYSSSLKNSSPIAGEELRFSEIQLLIGVKMNL